MEKRKWSMRRWKVTRKEAAKRLVRLLDGKETRIGEGKGVVDRDITREKARLAAVEAPPRTGFAGCDPVRVRKQGNVQWWSSWLR